MKSPFILQLMIAVALAALPFHEARARGIKISTSPIEHFLPSEPGKTRFGKLEFLGGLVLKSKDEHFGGISGARFSPRDGKLLAVTDKGRFITFALTRNGNRPASVNAATIKRLKGRNGKTLTGKYDKDAESLEIAGKQILVGFERNDRIAFYRRKGSKLKPAKDKKPIDLKQFSFTHNKGPEAIAIAPATSPIAGSLLAFAEFLPDHNNNHSGFIFKDGKIARIAMTESDAYSLTDAAFLDNGDLLMLERRYSFFTGIAMRLRRIKSAAVVPGAILDGEVLLEVGGDHQIDNLEAIALSKTNDGITRLTLLSDDNFDDSQRTILLEFKLAD